MSSKLKRKDWICIFSLAILIIIFYPQFSFAGSAILSWEAPTTNADGTSLTDLAGYKVYYGNSSGNYSNTIDIGNVTSYQVNNLTDNLTYYFVLTAYDTTGNESTYSNEVNKFIVPSIVPIPDITLIDSTAPSNDSQIVFGNITEGSSSDQTITITNDGNADLTIGTIAQSNTLLNPFTLISDQCSSRTLFPASNCTFTVRFSPAAAGLFSDSFDIPSNDPDENPLTFTLSGTGELMPLPDITVTDSILPNNDQQIAFGNTNQGSSSDQTITIANDGNADLTIGTIAQSNTLLNPFTLISDQCSSRTLSPASNCTFTVRFSPAAAGLFSDSFDIPSNDPDENPLTFTLSGTGELMPLPDITVTDSISPNNDQQIAFGNTNQGSLSEQTITITNDGNGDLTIGTIAQGNILLNPFTLINDQCSSRTLSPASACTVTVRFSPSAAGLFSDSFDIPSNDPDENPANINISGTGTTPPVPDITITDAIDPTNDLLMPFGDLTEGLLLDRSVTITNDGNADLIIGNIAFNNQLANPFTIINDQCSGHTLSPGTNCLFSVRYSPSSTGMFNDSFDIPSNDTDENPVVINTSGTGLPSIINNPPTIPATVFPANNQKSLGTTINFRWQKVTDPDGDPITYDLIVCEDPNLSLNCVTELTFASSESSIYYAGLAGFGPILLLVALCSVITCFMRNRSKRSILIMLLIILLVTFITACGGGGSGGSGGVVQSGNAPAQSENNEASQIISGLNAGTTYFWKVIVKDGNGGESESSLMTFETL